MQVIKPDVISLLFRAMEMHRQCFLVPTALIGFDLDNPAIIRDEAEFWPAVMQALGEDQALDLGYLKPVAEVLLIGSCHALHNHPVQASKVRLALANADKTIYVLGNRNWQVGLIGSRHTPPEPFLVMPLTYDKAFGGPGFSKNPVGKGFVQLNSQDGLVYHPLPNLEAPNDLIVDPSDRPDPVGFGPLDPSWPQRSARTGTYDAQWLKDQWPNFPQDFDWTYFNTAPEDQWLVNRPRGNEHFILEGVYPERPILESNLPGKKVRVFVTRGSSKEEAFSEIFLHIDTVWFFPDLNLGLIAFRGSIPVNDEEAREIWHLYAALEDLDSPQPVPEHFHDFQARIASPPMEADADSPVEPAPPTEPIMEEAPPTLSPEEQEALKKLEANVQKAEKDLAVELSKSGLKPEDILKTAAAPHDLPPMSVEQAEALLTKAFQEAGLDASLESEISTAAISDFKFDPRFVINSLSTAGLLTPELEMEIWVLDHELKALPAEKKDQEEAKAETKAATEPPPSPRLTRETILEQYAGGRRDFSGLNLAGIDLSRADLSGINLDGAVLVEADFSESLLNGAHLLNVDASKSRLIKADLREADLSGANFFQADLTEINGGGCLGRQTDFTEVSAPKARFREACFEGAILMAADFSEADFTQANLKSAVCSAVNLKGARLTEATLDQADLSRAKLAAADLSSVQGAQTDFRAADLTQARLIEARLPGADFDRATLTKADFTQVEAPSMSLHGALGEAVKFHAAHLENLRADNSTVLPKADFSDSRLNLSYFGGSDLTQANFSNARLDQAIFQDCRIARADFHQAQAREARFLKCDLTEARMSAMNLLFSSLAKSRCTCTDFHGSNLFGVDTLKTEFTKANIQGANLKRSRLEEQVRKP